MIRAVLFDVGGTLMVSHHDPALLEQFCALLLEKLAASGIDLPVSPGILAGMLLKNAGDYKRHSEKTHRELPAAEIWNGFYLREFSIGEERLAPIAEELSRLYDAVRMRNVPRPEMPDALRELHAMGLRLGVISNVISRTFTPRLLEDYGVAGLMECVILSSETTWRKPDPHNFRLAAEQLGIQLSEMAYVGDTLSRDVLGCRNAGVGLSVQIRAPEMVPLDQSYVNSGLKPDVLIQSLDELPGILRAHHTNQ